jgi:stearoyl-CoA desaturase (delta-9 desaturase)
MLPVRAAATLDWPPTTQPLRVFWSYFISVTLVHMLALTALWSWCFSWTGVIVCIAGFYVFGTLGINLGYHRLLTHRGLVVPLWLEHSLALLGLCCLEDTPARWVAIHRMHHQHSDEASDPHSPLVSFLWGHFQWLFFKNREHDTVTHYERYARDLLHDRLYFRWERRLFWLWVYAAHALAFFVVGLAVAWIGTGRYRAGLQFGVSLLVWGVLLRTVLVWHITWSVNSLAHIWGYQNYNTRDQSRNNWFVALVSNGEGWHNNHHWDQRCAAHGHRWWEFDVTYLTIRGLEWIGLAHNVVHPGRKDRPARGPTQSAATE